MAGEDQANTRRNATLKDDHGRKWYCVVEHRSGDPVGPISPLFSAPWVPDQAYLKPDPAQRDRLIIDYATAIRERLEADANYQRQWNRAATARTWDPKDPARAAALLELVGEPPAPWQPYKAAMDGNQWILGFTSRVDERVARFLPEITAPAATIDALPSFADLDSFADEEEDADPDALGGKIVPVTPAKRKGGRPPKAPLAA